MKVGTRAVLEAAKRKTIDVPVRLNVDGVEEEYSFTLQEMSGTERDRFEIDSFTKKSGSNGITPGEERKIEVDPMYLRARLVSSCLIDGETGQRLYSDAEMKLCSDTLGAGNLNTLFEAAQKLNGLEAKAVEQAAKNSESELDGASSSGSLDTLAKPSLNS